MIPMYEEIARLFHLQFISEKMTDETFKIALDYVKFTIETYEDLIWSLEDTEEE